MDALATPYNLKAGEYWVRWAPSREPEISRWYPESYEWETKRNVLV